MTNNDLIKDKFFLTIKKDAQGNKAFDNNNVVTESVFETDIGPEEPELSEYMGSCTKRIIIHFPISFEKFTRAYNKAMRYGCPLYVFPRGCY